MKHLLVVFVFGLIYCVEGWSTFHKSDKQFINFYENSARPLKECKDEISSASCNNFKQYCFNISKVTKLCKKTCGDCPAVSPMSCKASQFGCCWDNITTSGPAGAGCPECKDGPVCKKMQDMCDIAHVKRACPITCRVRACIEGHATCFDDPSQAKICPLFKKSKFCEIDPGLMKIYCKRTCNLCYTDQIKPIYNDAEQNIKVVPDNKKDAKDMGGNADRKKDVKETGENADQILLKMVKDEIKKSDDLKNKEFSQDEDEFIKTILADENAKKEGQKPIPSAVAKDTSDELLMNLLQNEVENELKKKESEEKLAEAVKKHVNTADQLKKADEALLKLLQEDSGKTKP